METANRIAALAAEIDAALPVLDRIDRFYDQFQQQQVAARQCVRVKPFLHTPMR